MGLTAMTMNVELVGPSCSVCSEKAGSVRKERVADLPVNHSQIRLSSLNKTPKCPPAYVVKLGQEMRQNATLQT